MLNRTGRWFRPIIYEYTTQQSKKAISFFVPILLFTVIPKFGLSIIVICYRRVATYVLTAVRTLATDSTSSKFDSFVIDSSHRERFAIPENRYINIAHIYLKEYVFCLSGNWPVCRPTLRAAGGGYLNYKQRLFRGPFDNFRVVRFGK